MFLFVATSHVSFLISIILSIRILSTIWSMQKKTSTIYFHISASGIDKTWTFYHKFVRSRSFFNITTVWRGTGTARIRIPSFCHYCERSRFDKLSFLRPVMFQCQTIAIMENPFAIKGSFSSLNYFFTARNSFFFFQAYEDKCTFHSISFIVWCINAHLQFLFVHLKVISFLSKRRFDASQ